MGKCFYMLKQHEGKIALVLHQPVAARAAGFLCAGDCPHIKADHRSDPFFSSKSRRLKPFLLIALSAIPILVYVNHLSQQVGSQNFEPLRENKIAIRRSGKHPR